jgi:hypothetical protein
MAPPEPPADEPVVTAMVPDAEVEAAPLERAALPLPLWLS